MNRFSFLALSTLLSMFFIGCTPDNGVAKADTQNWRIGRGFFSAEPKPYRPDPEVMMFTQETDPYSFQPIDERQLPKHGPTWRKGQKRDLYERGRDARIRRLVRER